MRHLPFYLFLMIFTLLITPASASEEATEFPTVYSLQQTVIPPADPVELARSLGRLQGVPSPVEAVAREAGQREELWVSNEALGLTFQVPARLRAIGEHVYLWVEERALVSQGDIKALVEVFDNRIYQRVRNLWGSEASPGIDNDVRLHILLAHNLGPTSAAYFARRHMYPEAVFPQSNEREMFFVNLDAFGTSVVNPFMESTLAHEFQHMIRAHINPNEDTWLNEGFSTFTELYLGYNTGLYLANSYLSAPGTQLNTFAYASASSTAHYGGALLFVTYFYERYGLDALRMLSASTTNGLYAVDDVLRQLGEPGMDEFFADWVAANLIQNRQATDGLYGYIRIPNAPVRSRGEAYTYPVEWSGIVDQYAVDYYTLNGLQGYDTLSLKLIIDDEVPLIPVQSGRGNWLWYSNRGDASAMTLTRTFDLREVESATMRYDIWYEIEEDWDYGYLMVSEDNGLTWQILPTPLTTTSNPYGNAYGPGYTGESGGWFEEHISLDAYTGQEILVRFAMITDDAVNMAGMAIDAVSMPEIGYFSDFEADDGGWESAGWVYTDNRLPQQAWLQAIQYAGQEILVARWLAPGPAWELPLVQGTDRVVLAVSPFAPVTTIAAPYRLIVAVD